MGAQPPASLSDLLVRIANFDRDSAMGVDAGEPSHPMAGTQGPAGDLDQRPLPLPAGRSFCSVGGQQFQLLTESEPVTPVPIKPSYTTDLQARGASRPAAQRADAASTLVIASGARRNFGVLSKDAVGPGCGT